MQKKETVEVVNVRLPGIIVELLDVLVKKGLYNSRSEAVRDFLRNYVKERGAK